MFARSIPVYIKITVLHLIPHEITLGGLPFSPPSQGRSPWSRDGEEPWRRWAAHAQAWPEVEHQNLRCITVEKTPYETFGVYHDIRWYIMLYDDISYIIPISWYMMYHCITIKKKHQHWLTSSPSIKKCWLTMSYHGNGATTSENQSTTGICSPLKKENNCRNGGASPSKHPASQNDHPEGLVVPSPNHETPPKKGSKKKIL